MTKKGNQALKELRRILGLTQAEFATLIGASKDTVASWDAGRNGLSESMARRIAFATGVDEASLLEDKGVPTVVWPVIGVRPYSAEIFSRYRRTTKGRSDEEGARHHLKHCADTLGLILLAAAGRGGGVSQQRLPAVLHSFIEWSEGVRREFDLGAEIDEQLEGRKGKSRVRLSYSEWRRLAREEPERVRAMGFKDDPAKGGEEMLELELEVRPVWMPGRRMWLPNAAGLEVIVHETKVGRGKRAG